MRNHAQDDKVQLAKLISILQAFDDVFVLIDGIIKSVRFERNDKNAIKLIEKKRVNIPYMEKKRKLKL